MWQGAETQDIHEVSAENFCMFWLSHQFISDWSWHFFVNFIKFSMVACDHGNKKCSLKFIWQRTNCPSKLSKCTTQKHCFTRCLLNVQSQKITPWFIAVMICFVCQKKHWSGCHCYFCLCCAHCLGACNHDKPVLSKPTAVNQPLTFLFTWSSLSSCLLPLLQLLKCSPFLEAGQHLEQKLPHLLFVCLLASVGSILLVAESFLVGQSVSWQDCAVSHWFCSNPQGVRCLWVLLLEDFACMLFKCKMCPWDCGCMLAETTEGQILCLLLIKRWKCVIFCCRNWWLHSENPLSQWTQCCNCAPFGQKMSLHAATITKCDYQ